MRSRNSAPYKITQNNLFLLEFLFKFTIKNKAASMVSTRVRIWPTGIKPKIIQWSWVHLVTGYLGNLGFMYSYLHLFLKEAKFQKKNLVIKTFTLMWKPISGHSIIIWTKRGRQRSDSFKMLKLIYSEKATKFCKISTNYLTGST